MPDTSDRSHPDESSSASHAPLKPRAFAQGAGLVLQVVGFVLLLSGCCLASFSGLIQGPGEATPAGVGEWLRVSPPAQLLAGINMILSGVLGFGLAVFGLGLHQERRGSGVGAMVCTGALALGWWATTVAAVVSGLALWRIGVHLLLAGGATALLVMAAAAHRDLKVNPPPPDEPVTEEFLAQFKRRKERVEEEQSDEAL